MTTDLDIHTHKLKYSLLASEYDEHLAEKRKNYTNHPIPFNLKMLLKKVFLKNQQLGNKKVKRNCYLNTVRKQNKQVIKMNQLKED